MNYFILFIFMLVPLYGKSFSIMQPSYNQTQQNFEITLNGIAYTSSTQWVIWVNNTRITPSHTPKWLKVNRVSEVCVECDCLCNNIWYKITLEPYETFSPGPISSKDKTDTKEN